MKSLKHPMLPLLAFLVLLLVAGGALLTSKHFAAHAAIATGEVMIINPVGSPVQSFKYQYQLNGQTQRNCQPLSRTGASMSFLVDVTTAIEIIQYTSTDCSGNVYKTAHQVVPELLLYIVTLPFDS